MTIFPGTSGDDIFAISAAVSGDQYNGGSGNDTVQLIQPPLILTNPFGSLWTYNFFGVTFSSIEKLDFSVATGQTNQLILSPSQFGAGFSNNLQVSGGTGADKLIIVATAAGLYTMPTFTKTNWIVNTSIAGLMNTTDIASLVVSGSGNYTLTAADIHPGIEALVGGAGNDTLNGGSSKDYLIVSIGNVSSTGIDVLNAGGGDDFLHANNQIGQFNTFSSTTFNGGTGIDTLVISGDVDFHGTVSSIEHLRLNPAVAATGGSTGFNNAVLTITESIADQFLPTLTLIEGFGDIEYTMESTIYDASAIQIGAGSHIEFDIFGTLGFDSMTGSAADEVFYGDDGDDIISAGAGNDGLAGDNGNDVLTGGAGNDIFAVSYGNDVITDFTVGEDLLAVPDVVANFDMLKPFMIDLGGISTVLRFDYGGATYQLTLNNVSLASLSSTSLFGTDYNSGDPGTIFNDTLFGSNFGDVIDGQAGNDIIFAGAGGVDQIAGGADNDTVVITASEPSTTNPFVNSSFDGGTGTDILRVSAFGTLSQTQPPTYMANFINSTVNGFEQLQFQGNAGSVVQAIFLLSQINTNLAGIVATGSSAADALVLAAGPAGTYTMPNITRNNWTVDLSAASSITNVPNSDVLTLVAGGTGGSSLTANANHVGIEALVGSAFGDILTGGNDTEFLNGGANGADQLFGGGGTDMLLVQSNTSQGNYADDLFDGGTGTDYLRVSGSVTFAGTLANMEGIWLNPATVGAGTTPSFGDAQLTIDAAHAAAFGTNALLRGKGSVIVNGTSAGTINLSGWQFETAPITVTINGSTGADTILGTSHSDTISGGVGVDTVVFSGNRSNYSISSGGNGKYTVTDNRLGSPNGTDTLSSIERLQFADCTVRMPTGRDFNADQVGDILFRNAAGLFATWQLSGQGGLSGGGNIGNPGSSNRLVGLGDFDGDGRSDLLFRDRSGALASWQISGTSITGGGPIGNPGGAFALIGTGDFNGDSKSDLLFLNTLTGSYASWDLNGRSIIGGGTIGTPGPSWTYKATADFNGDGKSDILFQNVNGSYAIWTLNDTAIAGGGTIGNPGASWFFKGTGDFNGDGKNDLLFQKNDGTYATWDLNGTAIVGGGTLGNPGAAWAFAGIADYNGDSKSDILLRNTNGSLKTWNLNDTVVIGSHTPGNPGSTFAIAHGHGANDFAALVFQNSTTSSVASWIVNGKAQVGGGTLGTPGNAWTAKAVGDFAGTGEKDILFQKTDGTLAVWQSNGVTQVGGGTIGNPGSAWTLKGVGDFNGDGKSDILFQNNISNQFATWNISGTTIIGGASIGAAAGYNFVATGDLNGDGKSDILFKDAVGKYAAWFMDDTRIIGGGAIGNPGTAWSFEALDDFNGDGRADILFKNNTGSYATWDLDGTSIVGGGTIGNPGGTWDFAKATDLNGDGRADLVFHDATGNYASWLINDTSIIGGSNLGSVNNLWYLI